MLGPDEGIDLDEVDTEIECAIKNGWFIDLNWCSNGLGPMRVIDHYRFKIKGSSDDISVPIVQRRLSLDQAKYLFNKYGDRIHGEIYYTHK